MQDGGPLVSREIGSAISLMPGDDLTVSTDSPVTIRLMQEFHETEVDAELRKEWYDAAHLRSEVQRLRRENKRLSWLIEHPDAYERKAITALDRVLERIEKRLERRRLNR